MILQQQYVPNALSQFPEKMETLVPVTQLYISIDAANKDSLQAVDRPLFKDFWERFLECIDVLKSKGQRTVLSHATCMSTQRCSIIFPKSIFTLLAGVPHDAGEAVEHGRGPGVSVCFQACCTKLQWQNDCFRDETCACVTCAVPGMSHS